MKVFALIVVLLAVILVGSWAYHGWIVTPEQGRGSVHAAEKENTAQKNAATQVSRGRAKNTDRIICTDGALTEIVYALGFGDRIVGADTTAVWPADATKKPSIGYVRRISSEGVLSLNPTLILNNQEAGPPEAVEQLIKSGIQVYDIAGEKQNRAFTVILNRISQIAEALGVPEKGAELVGVIQADLEAARKAVENRTRQKALFLFNPTVEKITAGGLNTGAHEFFTLCGLVNVAASVDGWKPLSQEAIAAAAPDILVATGRSHQNFATTEDLLKVHGLGQTPAGKTQRVIYVDTAKFLSGGPRVGETALEFVKTLYPDAAVPPSQSALWFRKVEDQFRE